MIRSEWLAADALEAWRPLVEGEPQDRPCGVRLDE